MTTTAIFLWDEAQTYVDRAREHLNPPLLRTKNIIAAQDADEWFRIAFLFPTLPEKSKSDLLIVRRFFLLARAHQARAQGDRDQSAEYSEAMAEQVARQLREALPSFSEVQRDILSKHYLITERD